MNTWRTSNTPDASTPTWEAWVKSAETKLVVLRLTIVFLMALGFALFIAGVAKMAMGNIDFLLMVLGGSVTLIISNCIFLASRRLTRKMRERGWIEEW